MTIERARRVLILAPHPDDEIVACGIAAMRARAAGARIFAQYLTTGVPACAASSRYDERVGQRRAEALAATRLLDLEPIGFHDTPARRLRFEMDRAAADIAAAIVACGAEALWVPAFEGAHQDHDAANALVAVVARELPVWEFAAYNFAGGRVRSNRFADERGGEVAIDAMPAEAARKRKALHCYASERRNLGHIATVREAYRPLPAHVYGAPPHAGRLFRERFHWVPFRHPRIDVDPSAEVYRDIAAWVSTRRRAPAVAMLDNGPGREARQADREFARPLDHAKRERVVGGEAGHAR